MSGEKSNKLDQYKPGDRVRFHGQRWKAEKARGLCTGCAFDDGDKGTECATAPSCAGIVWVAVPKREPKAPILQPDAPRGCAPLVPILQATSGGAEGFGRCVKGNVPEILEPLKPVVQPYGTDEDTVFQALIDDTEKDVPQYNVPYRGCKLVTHILPNGIPIMFEWAEPPRVGLRDKVVSAALLTLGLIGCAVSRILKRKN